MGFFWGGGHCYMILYKELLIKNKLINKCVSSKLQKKATEISKKKKKDRSLIKHWTKQCTEHGHYKRVLLRRTRRSGMKGKCTQEEQTNPQTAGQATRKGKMKETKRPQQAVTTGQVTALEKYYTRVRTATFTHYNAF